MSSNGNPKNLQFIFAEFNMSKTDNGIEIETKGKIAHRFNKEAAKGIADWINNTIDDSGCDGVKDTTKDSALFIHDVMAMLPSEIEIHKAAKSHKKLMGFHWFTDYTEDNFRLGMRYVIEGIRIKLRGN